MRAVRFAIAVALALGTASAVSAQADGVAVGLNKLEARDGACRAYLVIENGTASTFETLKLDLVMFDGDGVIARRLAVETAPLPADKTQVKLFDIQGQACGGIQRVLLNDVTDCADGDGSRSDCLDRVSVSSRAVPFNR